MTWQDTIRLLEQAGFKQADIAAHCNCGQSTISELANGVTKEPRYSLGQKLLELQAKARRKLAAQAKAA